VDGYAASDDVLLCPEFDKLRDLMQGLYWAPFKEKRHSIWRARLTGLVILTILTSGMCGAQTAPSRPKEHRQRSKSSTVAMIDKVQGTIVQVVVPGSNGGQIKGSGFWIAKDLVATCWHVVKDNPTSTFLVQSAIDSLFDIEKGNTVDGSWVRAEANFATYDAQNDIAILKVQGNSFPVSERPLIAVNGKNLSAHFAVARLAKNLPERGDEGFLGGYPLGRPFLVVQRATIAAVTYNLPEAPNSVKVLVNTLANHGNSGGPIFDSEGNVVAILEGAIPSLGNRDPAEAASGIEFAIPIQYLEKLRKSTEATKP